MEVTKILILLGISCLCNAWATNKDLAERQPERAHDTEFEVQFKKDSDTASDFILFQQLKMKTQNDSNLLFHYLLNIGSGNMEEKEEKPVSLTPENVSTSAGSSGNLVVNWRRPTSDSELLEGYKVYWACDKKQGEAEVAVANNNFTITGLAPCQKCDVYVTGRKKCKKNAKSKADGKSETVTGIAGPLEPNDDVVNVTAVVSDCRTKDVNVTWEVEKEGNEVGNFNVSWICQNNTSGSKQVLNEFNTNLTGLNSECNITVTRVNCAGIGPSSESITVGNNCVECPPDFKALPFGCYHTRRQSMNYSSSENYCSSKNGSSLYVAKSLDEFEEMKTILRNTTTFPIEFMYIGLRRNNTTRNWYWGNSTLEQPLGSSYWRAGEPDTNDQCAWISKNFNFTLYGLSCNSRTSALCFIRHN